MARLLYPWAASVATRCSAGVSASGPLRALRRGRTPAALSSSRARRASRCMPPRSACSSARRSGSRASARRLARRRAPPRSTSARVCSSRAGEAASVAHRSLEERDRLVARTGPRRAARHRGLRASRPVRQARCCSAASSRARVTSPSTTSASTASTRQQAEDRVPEAERVLRAGRSRARRRRRLPGGAEPAAVGRGSAATAAWRARPRAARRVGRRRPGRPRRRRGRRARCGRRRERSGTTASPPGERRAACTRRRAARRARRPRTAGADERQRAHHAAVRERDQPAARARELHQRVAQVGRAVSSSSLAISVQHRDRAEQGVRLGGERVRSSAGRRSASALAGRAAVVCLRHRRRDAPQLQHGRRRAGADASARLGDRLGVVKALVTSSASSRSRSSGEMLEPLSRPCRQSIAARRTARSARARERRAARSRCAARVKRPGPRRPAGGRRRPAAGTRPARGRARAGLCRFGRIAGGSSSARRR